MAFAIKTIRPRTSLGAELNELRESFGWTFEKASRETHIQSRYLRAIEEDRWDDLPGEPVTSHFIKRYIRALGNDPHLFARAAQFVLIPPVAPILVSAPRKRQLILTPAHLKFIGLGLVMVTLAIYLGLQIRTLVAPPTLTIETPAEGLTSSLPTIAVKGATEPHASVTINNQTVLTTSSGTFESTIDLEQGVNIITISAAKKYSKPNTIYRSVIFQNN